MKIYTRTGDDGTTGLYGGERVRKSSRRVAAYGAVDEANAVIGTVRACLRSHDIDEVLAELQDVLFDVGADLATPGGARQRAKIVPIDDEDIAALEATIDRFQDELEPLTHFILPGGSAGSAALQHARAVTRRAEREVAALLEAEGPLAADGGAGEGGVNPAVGRWLNRLSDLLFVLARAANVDEGVSETRWRVSARRRKAREARAPDGGAGGGAGGV